jgi:hypothetical protein
VLYTEMLKEWLNRIRSFSFTISGAVRADLHWLQLTSKNDLWYQGGGAFDNKVFGYTGRPGNGSSLSLPLQTSALTGRLPNQLA